MKATLGRCICVPARTQELPAAEKQAQDLRTQVERQAGDVERLQDAAAEKERASKVSRRA